MKIDIECISCNSVLTGKELVKQSLSQTKKQMFNWKVMFGLKQVEYIPTCNECGKEGESNFCCPKYKSKTIWSKDILKEGNLIHKCE